MATRTKRRKKPGAKPLTKTTVRANAGVKTHPLSVIKRLENAEAAEAELREQQARGNKKANFAGPGQAMVYGHPKRHLIDRALLEGVPLRQISREFFAAELQAGSITEIAGVQRLKRYKERELDTRVKRAERKRDNDVVGEYQAATKEVYARTMALMERAADKDQFDAAVGASKVLGEHVERWGRATGAIQDPEAAADKKQGSNMGMVNIQNVFALPHTGELVEGENRRREWNPYIEAGDMDSEDVEDGETVDAEYSMADD